MKQEFYNKIIALGVLLAAGGCSSIATQNEHVAAERPILSAADAQAMIQVTVTILPPIDAAESIVAAAD